VVLVTLVHVSVELVDLGVHQLLLDWLEIAESGFVASEELLESVDVPHVVFLLEGDVDDGLGNAFADSVQELGFSDNHFQVGCEVHFVIHAVTNFYLLQNVFFQKFYGFISVLTFPISKNPLFVVLVELFGQLDVFASNFSKSLGQKLVRFVFKLLDRSLDSSHNRSSPSNLTCFWWHVLGDRR